jgi:hypothetical protein
MAASLREVEIGRQMNRPAANSFRGTDQWVYVLSLLPLAVPAQALLAIQQACSNSRQRIICPRSGQKHEPQSRQVSCEETQKRRQNDDRPHCQNIGTLSQRANAVHHKIANTLPLE